MFYRLQKDENGNYTKDGQRYSLFGCNVCESKKLVETGEYEIIDGERVPIMEERVVINDGFTEFASEEEAAQYFGLTYDPINPEEADE